MATKDKKPHGHGSAFLNLWAVVAAGVVAVEMAAAPARHSIATPPPDTNNTSCVHRKVCCCLGSSNTVPGDTELLPVQGVDSRVNTGPIDRHSIADRCGRRRWGMRDEGSDHSVVSQPTQPGARPGASTSEDRPRRSSSAPALPSVLYIASTMSPEHVFEEGFSADLRTMGLGHHVSRVDSYGAWATPTTSARVAYEDAVDARCRPTPVQLVWVYQIRADESFYDLAESHCQTSQSRHPEPNVRLLGGPNIARSRARWMTFSEIPTENIRRAFPITERTSPPHGFQQPFPIDTAIKNRKYVHLNTRGSEQLLTCPND